MRARPAAGSLVLCFGNPARQDDGIGPGIADRLEALALAEVALAEVAVESSYQLCVEDALAVAESELVVFVDAAAEGEEPYSFERVVPRPGLDYTTHSLRPAQVLGLAEEIFGRSPESYLLAIRGYSFDMFEEGLTEKARVNLEAASEFLADFLRRSARTARRTAKAEAAGPCRSRLPGREREHASADGENAQGGAE